MSHPVIFVVERDEFGRKGAGSEYITFEKDRWWQRCSCGERLMSAHTLHYIWHIQYMQRIPLLKQEGGEQSRRG